MRKMKWYGYRIRGSLIMAKTEDYNKRDCLRRLAKSFGCKQSDIEIWEA